jgi:hypothetical protein
MQPLVGCEENCQQGCVTVGLSTIGADRWTPSQSGDVG